MTVSVFPSGERKGRPPVAFDDRIEPELNTGCFLWSGGMSGGYGTYRLPHQRQTVNAHRWAYCRHHNISLEQLGELVVRHKCDTPACVNPAHLEPGTRADNVQDKVERGRGVYPGRPPALTHDQIADIKQRLDGVRGTGIALAREYGVSPSFVSLIARGKRWADVGSRT